MEHTLNNTDSEKLKVWSKKTYP